MPHRELVQHGAAVTGDALRAGDEIGFEVIEPGVSGFIVNSEEEALAAIARIATLDRRRVRAAFERRFTATGMARAYLEVFAQLLEPGELRASGKRPGA